MLNLADFIFMAFVLLMTIIGVARGLVKSLFGFGSILLSLILAMTLYPWVSDVLTKSPVGVIVSEKTEAAFGAKKTEEANLSEENTNMLPEAVRKTVQNTGEQLQKSIAEQVASLAIRLISMLLVFLLVRLLLWILSRTLNLITKLPVIHACNKLFGGAFGLLSSVLIVYLLLGLLTFTSLLNTTSDFGRTVQNSMLVSKMYENNILLYFLRSN